MIFQHFVHVKKHAEFNFNIHFGPLFEPSWAHLGGILGPFAAISGPLGVMLWALGVILGPLWAILDDSWNLSWYLLNHLGAFWSIWTPPGKLWGTIWVPC